MANIKAPTPLQGAAVTYTMPLKSASQAESLEFETETGATTGTIDLSVRGSGSDTFYSVATFTAGSIIPVEITNRDFIEAKFTPSTLDAGYVPICRFNQS